LDEFEVILVEKLNGEHYIIESPAGGGGHWSSGPIRKSVGVLLESPVLKRFADITVESLKFHCVNTGKGKNLLGRGHSNLYKMRDKIYGDVLKRQWKIERTATMLPKKN